MYMKKFGKCLAISIVSLAPFTPIFQDQPTSVIVEAEQISPKEHAEQVLNELNGLYPGQIFPTRILMEDSPVYLAVSTSDPADRANFDIYYYAEESPIPLNDQQLNDLEPIASFRRVVYEDAETAQKAVKQIINENGEPVDLGYGITGYQSGTAGSKYLTWQEGNWSFNIQSLNQNEDDPISLAQEIVQYLEKIALPAPEVVGQINLRMASSTFHDNVAAWQEGNVVYITSHADPMTLIQMTGSITNPTEQ